MNVNVRILFHFHIKRTYYLRRTYYYYMYSFRDLWINLNRFKPIFVKTYLPKKIFIKTIKTLLEENKIQLQSFMTYYFIMYIYLAKIKENKSKYKFAVLAWKISKHLEFWIRAENFIIIVLIQHRPKINFQQLKLVFVHKFKMF